MNFDTFLLMKPELSLIFIIFILLILKVWDGIQSNKAMINIANALFFIYMISGFFLNGTGELFSGMYHTNAIIAFEKNILSVGAFIIFLQSYDWLEDNKNALEFYVIIMCTLLGMEYMISSGNFLMFYLGLELSSIPLATLANFDLDKPKSSEAAGKLIISSAFASAIMLFGISMLYGTTGTLNFNDMAMRISSGTHYFARVPGIGDVPSFGSNQLSLFAFILIFAGFAFKLSIVPFHLWTADVYEGAPVPVTSYLSVISKGSVIFIFITVLFTLFNNLAATWYNILYLCIMLTIIVGNLFALRQNNIKRFLAFSSITQMGYILLGVSSGTSIGASAAVFFLIVYTFSNLGAFGVVSLVAATTGKEEISDYRGFYVNNKFAGWVLAISLFSLAGIPPTAGFFGKMFLVTAGAAKGNYVLISLAALNMVVSLYYYLKVVKAVFIDKNDTPLPKIMGSLSSRVAMAICLLGIIATGFSGGLFEYINTIIK